MNYQLVAYFATIVSAGIISPTQNLVMQVSFTLCLHKAQNVSDKCGMILAVSEMENHVTIKLLYKGSVSRIYFMYKYFNN